MEYLTEMQEYKKLMVENENIFVCRYKGCNNTELLRYANFAASELVDAICSKTTPIYFKYRKLANAITDAKLLEQFVDLEKRKNVIYESTGSESAFPWLLKVADSAKKLGFRVHLVFSVAPAEALVARAVFRAVYEDGRLPCPLSIRKADFQSRSNFGHILAALSREESLPFKSILALDNNISKIPREFFLWKNGKLEFYNTRLLIQKHFEYFRHVSMLAKISNTFEF